MDELQGQILEGMLAFIEGDEDAEYSPEDVKECGILLAKFRNSITSGASHEEAMEQVKQLVLSLNELNERCEHSIIETDQREQICELIFQSLSSAGIDFEGDVTEDWREW